MCLLIGNEGSFGFTYLLSPPALDGVGLYERENCYTPCVRPGAFGSGVEHGPPTGTEWVMGAVAGVSRAGRVRVLFGTMRNNNGK